MEEELGRTLLLDALLMALAELLGVTLDLLVTALVAGAGAAEEVAAAAD